MHNLALSREALDIIRDQSAKLASLSKDLPTWNSGPYACCLRLVNSQTAEKLRKFWKLYSGNAYLTPSFLATYCASIKATKRNIPPRAWGPTTHMHEMFWDLGDYDCIIDLLIVSTRCSRTRISAELVSRYTRKVIWVRDFISSQPSKMFVQVTNSTHGTDYRAAALAITSCQLLVPFINNS